MKVHKLARLGHQKPIEGTEDIELVGERTTVILFFHGYTGFPAEVLPTATAMHQQGYTVVIPRLMGHGSSIASLHATTADDWLTQALCLYLHWQSRGYHIIPAGLSMGGLIACWLAASQQCRQLIMLAPAFALRDQRLLLAPLLQHLLPSVPCKGNQYNHKTTGPPDEISEVKKKVDQVYHGRHFLGPLSQLLRIKRWSIASLKNMHAQTFLALAEHDQTVSNARTTRILKTRLPSRQLEQHLVPAAQHVLTRTAYQPQLLPPLLDWLQRYGGNAQNENKVAIRPLTDNDR